PSQLRRQLPMPNGNGPCGSRRKASMRGPPISATCGISSKMSREDIALAQKYFQKAIDLDPPSQAATRALLGLTARRRSACFSPAARPKRIAWPKHWLARRSNRRDRCGSARDHRIDDVLSRGDYEGALAEARIALSISPNLALAHGARGE